MTIGVQLKVARKGSTYVVTVDFENEDQEEMTPTTILWKLTDTGGDIINSREDEVATPAASVNVVLSGNDLPVNGNREYEAIWFIVYGTYTSNYGSGLPYKEGTLINVYNIP